VQRPIFEFQVERRSLRWWIHTNPFVKVPEVTHNELVLKRRDKREKRTKKRTKVKEYRLRTGNKRRANQKSLV